jgi:hypothetical protein
MATANTQLSSSNGLNESRTEFAAGCEPGLGLDLAVAVLSAAAPDVGWLLVVDCGSAANVPPVGDQRDDWQPAEIGNANSNPIRATQAQKLPWRQFDDKQCNGKQCITANSFRLRSHP